MSFNYDLVYTAKEFPLHPEVPLQEWLEKYPALDTDSMAQEECSECGREFVLLPYVSEYWIGVETKACVCGSDEGFVLGYNKDEVAARRELGAWKEFIELSIGEVQ